MIEAINAIEVFEISKSFSITRVVDSVSFSVRPGEIFGLCCRFRITIYSFY